MNIEEGVGSGWRNIIPSARRGIHSYCRRLEPTRDNMVRYADDSSEDERPVAEGTDEVDNVMRMKAMTMVHLLGPSSADCQDDKLSNTSSAPAMRRRNSMTPPNQPYTEDSDDDALAKSLPATLPSYSHCSDDLEVWHSQGSSFNHNKSDISTPRSKGNRSSDSRNFSRSTLSPQLEQSRRKEKYSEGTLVKYLLGLAVVCSLAYYYELMKPSLESNQNKYDEFKFHNDLTELGAKYNVDGNSVLQLQAGISTIFKREDTSCFVFVYNSMTENFSSNRFDGFVNNVASNTAKFLRNESASVQHIVVDGSSLDMGSHSQVVKAFRERVASAGVLLVRDVARVPSPLAMAFHYYCDEYNPLVKRSAVFFTLDAARCRGTDEKSSHASVEKCLKEKWHTVPRDNIGPLLTRVVSVVVDVTKWF